MRLSLLLNELIEFPFFDVELNHAAQDEQHECSATEPPSNAETCGEAGSNEESGSDGVE